MDFKSYAQSKQTLIFLELERVEKLLEFAGNPDKKLRVIHVAGTNGKGSVCAFVQSGLIYMKKRVGKFSSPELFDVTDTISVDGVNISKDELSLIYDTLSVLCDRVKEETGKMPSQFEINFVAALVHFVNCGCEYAIIECGMGGTGDATNAVSDSEISIITGISLDHTGFLGNTCEEIASVKCGIFKKSSEVVTGFQSDAVMDVICRKAEQRKLHIAAEPVSTGFEGMNEIFDYDGVKNLKSSLCGVHQMKNAAIAIEALKLLGAGEDAIRYAVSNAKNPARLEKISDGVYFDGGHNPDGVGSLVESLNRYAIDGKIIFALGMMADKDIEGALLCLNKMRNRNFEIHACSVQSNPRSESGERICEIAKKLGFAAKAFDNINSVCENADGKCDFIMVFGSLYMYKELTYYAG